MRRIDKDINKLENKISVLENKYDRYKEDYDDMYKYWEEKDPNIAKKIKILVNNELSIIDDLKTKLENLNKVKKKNE